MNKPILEVLVAHRSAPPVKTLVQLVKMGSGLVVTWMIGATVGVDRDVRGMSDSMKSVASALAAMKGELSKTNARIDSLTSGTQRLAAASSVPSYDLLSSEDIEELGLLVEHADDVHAFTSERIMTPIRQATYEAFWRIGLLACAHDMSGRLIVLQVMPTARWLVERHAKLEAERIAREGRESKRFWLSFAVEIIAVILAWVLGVWGTMLVNTPTTP